jgi:hypothetical protein
MRESFHPELRSTMKTHSDAESRVSFFRRFSGNVLRKSVGEEGSEFGVQTATKSQMRPGFHP